MDFNIDARHPLYEAFAEAWERMRDAADGEDSVKLAGQRHLPMKSGMKALTDLKAQEAAYDAYRLRAEFPEWVAPTIRGAVGMMHDVPATIALPARLEHLIERATPDGLTLDELHRRITTEVLTVGRVCLVVVVVDGLPLIATYAAERAQNWDGDGDALTYLVLNETDRRRDPATNTWRDVRRYFELEVRERGYQARRWTQDADGKLVPGEWEAAAAGDFNASPIPQVPAVFVNTLDRTSSPDDIPLYGLAKTALRSYTVDADYRLALHITAEPTPYVTGYEDPVQAVKDGATPRSIGASALWVLPPGASAGFLEFSGAGVGAMQAEKDACRRAAVMQGAQMFADDAASQESGKARALRLNAQTVTFKHVALVSAAGLERALRMAATFVGQDPKAITVSPYLDWLTPSLEPAEITALSALWEKGAISWPTLFDRLQRGRVVSADVDPDDEMKLIQKESEERAAAALETSPGEDPDEDVPPQQQNVPPQGGR